jgi:hypothetical protein
VVCDICGKDEDARHYKIVLPDGRIWAVDLCSKHSGPLDKYPDEGIGHLAPQRQGKRRTFEKVTLAEVQERARKRS